MPRLPMRSYGMADDYGEGDLGGVMDRSGHRDMAAESSGEGEDDDAGQHDDDDDDDRKVYCTCQRADYGEMIACDNEACPVRAAGMRFQYYRVDILPLLPCGACYPALTNGTSVCLCL